MWSPAYLSSARGWWKANEVGGNSGDHVLSWPDASATGNTAASANYATLNTPDLNSLNTLHFDGGVPSHLALPAGAVAAFTEGTIFFVAKPSSGAAMGLPVGWFGTGPTLDRYNYDAANGIGSEFLSNATHSFPDPGGTTAWHIAGFRSKAGDWRARWNGTEVFTTAVNTVGAPAGTPYFGWDQSGTPFDGNLAEVVLCNSFLTTNEAERIEGYLAWKWGLQALLPVGHTYAVAAPTVLLVAYSLTADTGTFSYTGQAANLLRGYNLAAAQGAFSYAGQAANLTVAYSMPAALVTFTYTGQAANLLRGYNLSAASGTVTYTGQAANLLRNVTLPAAFGTFSNTGQSATLTRGYDLAANFTTFAYSGQAAALIAAYKLTAAAGAFVYSGQGATIFPAYLLPAGFGSFAYTGQSAALVRGLALTVTVGIYTVQGKPATLSFMSGGRIKAFNGASFVPKSVKVWTGAGWAEKRLKRWNGAAWALTGY